MRKTFYLKTVVAGVLLFSLLSIASDSNSVTTEAVEAKASVIECKGMIDNGLYESIKRRTELALKGGSNYLIYEIGTYGGLVKAADDISKYLMLETGKKARTVAYIDTEAISAGAMISVSCQDIIMRNNTKIGDCAPIMLGGKLEGVEREKTESFIRAIFDTAAEANGYPSAVLRAMVSMKIKVFRVKNKDSGSFEYFEEERLPTDANSYALSDKELVVSDDKILTLTSSKAVKYDIARAEVNGLSGAIEFLEERDGVVFSSPPIVYKPNWSEQMVRWLNSPMVMSVLVMIAMLGVYLELSSPGIGLPGLAAAICFAVIIGSKYLTGMANWVEIAVFVVGILLLLIEIFVLPGFGIAGILGIICILFGIFGMLIKNPPGKLPWPHTTFDWRLLTNNVLGLSVGFIGFVVIVLILTKHLSRIPIVGRLVLATPEESATVRRGLATPAAMPPVEVGQKGVSVGQLRPSGIARFGNKRLNVVSRGELIEANKEIIVAGIEGNSIVVKEIANPKSTA